MPVPPLSVTVPAPDVPSPQAIDPTCVSSVAASVNAASRSIGRPLSATSGEPITDDDGGIATRQTTVVVTDATGAVCALPALIGPTPVGSNSATVSALTQLLSQIHGNNDGLAENGACDMFVKNNFVAAVVKLAQAVQTIETTIAAGGLTQAQVEVLRLAEARLILAAKWTAVTLSRTTTDAQKLAAAAALGSLADAAMASNHYLTAIAQWLETVRLLAPLT